MNPTNLFVVVIFFLFFFCSCSCVSTEQRTEGHTRLKRVVCAQSMGVSVLGTSVLNHHALLARNVSSPLDIYTVNGADSYSTN